MLDMQDAPPFLELTPDDILRIVHENRHTPYPAEISLESIVETLHGILETIMISSQDKAATSLATLIDTLENVGKHSP